MGIVQTIQNLVNPYTPVDPNKVLIIDISHWSGVCNLQLAKDRGVKGVIIKSMDGVKESKFFRENYAEAVKVGMPVGCYTWLYSSSVLSPIKQADAFLELMKDFPCQIPHTVDFEKTVYGGNPSLADLWGIISVIENEIKRKPIIYTGPYFWLENGASTLGWKAYPLWIANYGVSKPMAVKPWGLDYTMWQFTDRMESNGISLEKMVDANYFSGSLESFYAFCGITTSPTPNPDTNPIPETPIVIEPPITPAYSTYKITVNSLNIRTQPTVSSPSLGMVYLGNSVSILEYKRIDAKNVWGRIDIGKWICMLQNGSSYTSKVDFSDVAQVVITPPVIITDGKSATVVIASLNVRSGIGTTYPAVGNLVSGAKVTIISRSVDAQGNTWGNIGVDKWICMIYQGTVYVKYDSLIEVVTPVVVPPTITEGKITTFTVPNDGFDYYQTQHDFQTSVRGYTPRSITLNYKSDPPSNALPETIPLLNPKEGFFPMSEKWQRFWFDLLRLASYGKIPDEELKKRWESLTDEARAFNDRHSRIGGYTDYILGVTGPKGPMQIKSLTTGGNIVKALSVNGTIITIECLNFSKDPPNVNDVWQKKIHLYQWATSETVIKLSQGVYRVVDFPQLHPYNGSPVMVGSWDGTQKIDKANCSKVLTPGKTYNIYV